MVLSNLFVVIISKTTCSRLDSKGIFNKQLDCLITTETKNAIQTHHCLFTLCSLNFSVAFGHCEKKKRKIIKQALNLRPLPASALVKIHSRPGEISHKHINKINTRCSQIQYCSAEVEGLIYILFSFLALKQKMRPQTRW